MSWGMNAAVMVWVNDMDNSFGGCEWVKKKPQGVNRGAYKSEKKAVRISDSVTAPATIGMQ